MLTDILEVNQKDLTQMYKFAVKHGNNIIALGSSGVGKTDIAKQVISDLDYKYVYLNLSVLEAPDFMGIPSIVDNRTSWATPEFWPLKDEQADDEQADEKPLVILLDELDKTKPEIQNPLLELLSYHSINDTKLNIKAIIGTGNRPDEGAFSQPISRAVTNRCSVFSVRAEFEPWREWAVQNNIDEIVVGFLYNHQTWLLKSDYMSDPTAYCGASPRSWTLSAQALAMAKNTSTDFQYKLVAGHVGVTAATQLKVWLTHYKEVAPHVERLIKEGTFPSLSAVDQQLMCAISAVKYLTESAEPEKEEIKNIFKWIKTIPAEYSICAIKSSLNEKVLESLKLYDVQEFLDVTNKIADLQHKSNQQI
jgi:hypothetical protein